MTEEKERILVFCSREICYASGNFFANQLGAALEELGFLVQVCEFTREDDFDRILEPLLSNTYRLAVDFNSLLPRMELEDGTSFIEKLGCPFFSLTSSAIVSLSVRREHVSVIVNILCLFPEKSNTLFVKVSFIFYYFLCTCHNNALL